MYEFTDKLALFPAEAPWYYVYVPVQYWEELRVIAAEKQRGFGAIKVTATIQNHSWETSIFPDTQAKKYILFIKKQIRKATGIDIGDTVHGTLHIKE